MQSVYFYYEKDGRVYFFYDNDPFPKEFFSDEIIPVGFFITDRAESYYRRLKIGYPKSINEKTAINEVKKNNGFLQQQESKSKSKRYQELEAVINSIFVVPKKHDDKIQWLTNNEIIELLIKRGVNKTFISPYYVGVSLKNLGFKKKRKFIRNQTRTAYAIKTRR